MKKFFIILFVFILSITPLTLNAEGTNYAKDLKWEKGLCSEIIANGLDVEFRGINLSYNTAFLDILPAIKKAIGDNNIVTITIQAKIKAVFSEAGAESVCRPALRAHIGIKDPQSWTEQYIESLNGDAPFFTSKTSNVMTGIGKATIPLKENWSDFSFDVTATKNQINSPMTPNWYFCFDGINLNKPIGAIFVKDLTVTLKEASKATPTPVPTDAPTPRPTPTDNPGQMSQALPVRTANAINPITPTKAPTPTPSPTPDWKEQPIVNDMAQMVSVTAKVSLWIIIVMGIVYLFTKIRERKNKQ